jgi:dGTPase
MEPSERSRAWAATMAGTAQPDGVVIAHEEAPPALAARRLRRAEREELQDRLLAGGATRAVGAGARERPEEPDPERTCFERDRDRILHSTAFRRLAGKTQVFVFPADHQRTRLTHALEVSQVATSVARSVGLNVALTEAIALGHDCGHGPGGHASEEAFDAFLAEGYDHAEWGPIALESLNLCTETLDGIRNHSWSRPTPSTVEGAVVSWADRCAYSAHDLEDAIAAGVVTADSLPAEVVAVCGERRGRQLSVFIKELVDCISETGVVGMRSDVAGALAALREFNYKRIYSRPESQEQGAAVVAVLRALVEYYAAHPAADFVGDPTRAAVHYVAGMTDRYAFDTALAVLGWDPARLPRGIDTPARG